MSSPSGPPPLLGLVAALVVLFGGVAAALTQDGETSTRTSPGVVASTRPSPATSTSSSTTRSTLSTLPPTSLPPISTTSTTVRPAVPTPEAAANGLWAAYTSGNQSAAARFASAAVTEALFSTPFSGEEYTFQSCVERPGQNIFDCRYEQASTKYTMTAEADAARSFKIVVIEIVTAATTTTSTSSG